MRPPIRAMVGNLVWNRAGQVWAVYAVDPVGAMHQSHGQRIKVFNRLRSAFMRLPTEAHLLSIGETIDPFDVLTATLPADGRLSTLGRDLQERYEGYLTSQRSVRRTHYVALLLDRVGTSEWRTQFDAGLASVTETLGATTMPSPKAVKRCEARACEMAAKCGSLRLQAVTAGRVRWLSARLLARGVDDVMFDDSWEPRTGAATTSLTGPFQEVRFLEGGSGDDEGRSRLGRYVRCDTGHGSGFHTCLVLSDMPTNWTFPGDGELLAELESAAEETARGDVIEADISIRIKRIENAKARKKTKGKRTTLVHQRGEYAGSATGAPGSLDSASASLHDLEEALDRNKAEPELECTVIVHLADSSLARLERHAESLQSQFEPANYGLVRPIGDQMKLLAMMWPPNSAATPVRLMTPMITPTRVQAMATGSAWRAPSASAFSATRSVSRPPLANHSTAASPRASAMIEPMPYLKKLDAASPISTQKMPCSTRLPKRFVSAAPKIRMTVSASPTMPENSGV